MDVTIAIDDALLARALDLARRRGITFEELIERQLRALVGERGGAEVARELLDLMETGGGRSGGRRWRREDAYAGRT